MLGDIYEHRCDLAVAFFSGEYDTKAFTQSEHARIRSRILNNPTAQGKLGVLRVRVGEGLATSVPATTLYADMRNHDVASIAASIAKRVGIVQAKDSNDAPPDDGWPVDRPDLQWPMADHAEAREAFASLLTGLSRYRILPIRGLSETGKSHMSKQMLTNVHRLRQVTGGRFDFKGTTSMDMEFSLFTNSLDIDPLPGSGPREQFNHILRGLKQRAKPTVIVFDTYEAAGEANDWIDGALLLEASRSPWLRVVIVGQRVPECRDKSWETICHPTIDLTVPSPDDWFSYGSQHRTDGALTLDIVTQVHQLTGGSASTLASICRPRTR